MEEERKSEIIIISAWLHFNLLRSVTDSFSLWAQLGPSEN